MNALAGAGSGRCGGIRGAVQGAFTLIELLVVVTVIAILSGLLVPGLSYARQSAKSTMCQSNLRQLGVALAMYVQNHDDHWMPIHNSELSYWFGLRTTSDRSKPEGRAFDRTKGYLYPYLRVTRAVEQCPGFEMIPRFDGKLVGYAYNYREKIVLKGKTYWKGLDGTVTSSQVRQAARLVVFIDGARVSDGSAVYYTPAGCVEENYYLQIPAKGMNYETVHFRHLGRANAVFADGHVEPLTPRSMAPIGDGKVGHFCDVTDWEQYYCP